MSWLGDASEMDAILKWRPCHQAITEETDV